MRRFTGSPPIRFPQSDSPRDLRSGERSRFRTSAALVFLIAFGIYSWTVGFGFVFDDDMLVANNEHLESLLNLGEIWTSTGWEGAGRSLPWYRPLTETSYAFDFAVSGLSPWSYHLTNVLLHGLVSILVLCLAVHLGAGELGALLAALVFAVHPIHVEAVANIAGRKELLASALVLGAVLAHRKAISTGPARYVLLSALLAVGAMFSKEIGVVTLGLLLALDLLQPVRTGDKKRTQALSYLLQSAGAAFYLLVRLRMIGSFGWSEIAPGDNPLAWVVPGERIATAIVVIGRGLLQLAFPLELMPDYSDGTIPIVESFLDPRYWLTLAALGALSLAALVVRRRDALPLSALAWYGITLLPASNLLIAIGTIYGERLLYLPSVGFCLLVGWVFAQLQVKTGVRITASIALLILCLLGIRTVTYSRIWESNETLFVAAAKTNPSSGKLQHGLALVLEKTGREEEAISAYRRALELNPRMGSSVLNLGRLLKEQGRLQEAEALYLRVTTVSGLVPALYDLAALYRDSGRLEQAVPLWERILKVKPDHAGALLDLGTHRFLESSFDQAEELWLEAARIEPNNPTVWFNLGLLHERQGNVQELIFYWRRFLDLATPDFTAQRQRVETRLQGLESESGADTPAAEDAKPSGPR